MDRGKSLPDHAHGLPDLQFNITHTRGLVAAAVAFFADLEFSAGRYERGTTLLAAESSWRLGLDARPAVSFWTWPMPTPDEARRQLGDAAFGRAWTAGQRMTLEQAAEDVLEDAD